MGVTGIVTIIVIVALGIYVFGSLLSISSEFKKIETKSKGIYRQTKSETAIDKASFKMGYDVHHALDIEAMDELRDKYNKISSKYYSRVQLISVFPLMGLLGTVLGLIPGLKAVQGGDIELLANSLSTALYSTLAGLIISIVLKIYVAHGPSITSNNIETNLAETDRRYDYTLKFNKITNTEQ